MQTDELADVPDLQQFLDNEPAATLALPIDDAGTIHAATLLFWHSLFPLRFYFVTSRGSEKCQLLATRDSLSAACVVGTSRGTKMSLQMRGTIRIVDKATHANEIEQYYRKRGNHHDDIIDPNNVLLQFTPSWARYTNYAKGYEWRMLHVTSENNGPTAA